MTLDGVLIERASLHNENEVNRLGLGVLMDPSTASSSSSSSSDGLMGDKEVFVRVKRAGEVIPKIIGLDSVRRSFRSADAVLTDTAGPSDPYSFSSSSTSSAYHCRRYRLPDVCPVCGSRTERVVSRERAAGEENEEEDEEDGDDDDEDVDEEEEDAGPAPVTVRCSGGGATCSAQAVEQIR